MNSLRVFLAGCLCLTIILLSCEAKLRKENVLYAIDVGAKESYKSLNLIQYAQDGYLDSEYQSRVADYQGAL